MRRPMLALTLLSACRGGSNTPNQGSDSSTAAADVTGQSNTTGVTSGAGPADTTATSTPGDGTGAPATGTAGDSTTGGGVFHFEDAPPDAYTQVDRIGVAMSTMLMHIHGDKDAFNQGSPEGDVAGFPDSTVEAADSMLLLHYGADLDSDVPPSGPSGLDEELLLSLGALGVSLCTPSPVGAHICPSQLAPNYYPDSVTIELGLAPGYTVDPTTCGLRVNGRRPNDTAADYLLALTMLDLSAQVPEGGPGVPCDPSCNLALEDCPHSMATVFRRLPADAFGPDEPFSLNPAANDVPFDDEFPYLAPAHAL